MRENPLITPYARARTPVAWMRTGADPMTDAQGPRPFVRRHHWMVRFTHWVTVLVLAGMITSGLQIYEAYARFGNRGGPYLPRPLDGAQFPHWSRLGGRLAAARNWHLALTWPPAPPGRAQPAPGVRLLVQPPARRPPRAERARHLQADAARLAHRPVRRVPGGPLLALLDRVALRGVHHHSRAARVRRGSGVAAGDD